MKAILVLAGYFGFAMVFGMALVALRRDERPGRGRAKPRRR